ncbi:sporulation protein [Brevibacillus ginsengisoli]|uniref:sporulation protein n=1 Tax=Brevibacillus ginsengisoli TaxID=363854 RepID=UPI003CF2D3B5
MSFFKKILASVGVGSAKVDARLHNDRLIPGEMITGEVHMEGGEIEQEIDDIYMYVITHYEREHDNKKGKEECILAKQLLSTKFKLKPKEEKVLTFSFPLPYETPLTMGRQPVYIRTGLDIKNAIDPGDSDFIQVLPHPLMEHVLGAIGDIGFQLFKVDCEYNRLLGRNFPFVQEFEFRPTGEYRSRLEELEVVFFLKDAELDVYIELDKRARGFLVAREEAFNMDERYLRFHVTEAELKRPRTQLAEYIDEMIRVSVKR